MGRGREGEEESGRREGSWEGYLDDVTILTTDLCDTHTHTHTHTHSGNRQLGSAKASGIGDEPEPVSILHPQVRTPTTLVCS